MHNPILKLHCLAGVAFCAPLPAMAQQIASEWSPMDDAIWRFRERSRRRLPPPKARRGDKREGPRVEFTPYIEVQQVLVRRS